METIQICILSISKKMVGRNASNLRNLMAKNIKHMNGFLHLKERQLPMLENIIW